MGNAKTTLCGAFSAAASAVAAVTGLPPLVHTLCLALSSVALALLGFFSQDAAGAETKTGTPVKIALLAGVLLVVTGCTLSQLHLAASSPTWGALDIGIGGGTIGNASQRTARTHSQSGTAITSTNLPPIISTNTPTVTAPKL